MSAKKRKKAGKKKAISAKGRAASPTRKGQSPGRAGRAAPGKAPSGRKKKLPAEKLQRKILPFTAGKLPSVSKAMPPAASAIPLVSKEIPSVSKPLPQVSAKPGITIPKYWGTLPSKKWGRSEVPVSRRREPKRPEDIGLFKFLGKVITAPYQPVEMVKAITAAIGAQAEEEKDPKAALEQVLLELKMRYEMGEITEDDLKIKETKLKKQIKDLEEKRKKRPKAKEVKKRPKEKKKRKK